MGLNITGYKGPDEKDQLNLNSPTVDFALVHAAFDTKEYKRKEDARRKGFATKWNYYNGKHKRFLKVKMAAGSIDDNVVVNFCGVLVDRTVSRLFGDPTRGELLTFDVEKKSIVEERAALHGEGPEYEPKSPGSDELKAHTTLNDVWARSGSLFKLLSRVGVFGAVTGHFAYKLMKEEEGIRVIVLDTDIFGILSRADDMDKVRAYKLEYEIQRRDPKDPNERIVTVDFRQLIVHGPAFGGPEGWYLQDFINWRRKGDVLREWVPDSLLETWPFCPIIDGQNLPHAQSIWGISDMQNVTSLNDEINFLLSNVNRIVRFHAHPRTIAIGVDPDSIVETAIEQFWTIAATPDQVSIQNLEMESDLNAAFAFFQTIREAFWTIGREADPAVFKEKIGNVTNFGLRVMFLDALNKLGQKRETYGRTLIALIERIFILSGYEDLTVIPKWSDPLPTDPREAVETMMLEIDTGILSRETAARERGRNWQLEQQRIKAEAEDANTMGQKLLRLMKGGESTKPHTDKRNLNG